MAVALISGARAGSVPPPLLIGQFAEPGRATSIGRSMKIYSFIVALSFAMSVSPAPAEAQERGTITIAGTVTDGATGAPLAGAIVQFPASCDGSTKSVTTGPDGRFQFTVGGCASYVRITTKGETGFAGMPRMLGTATISRSGYAPAQRELSVVGALDVVALRPLGAEDTRVETARTLERLTVTAVRATDAAPVGRTTLERTALERDYSGQDVPLTLRQAPSVTAYSESGSLLNYSYFRVRGIDQSRVAITLDGVPLNEPEDQQIYFSDFPDLTSSIQSMQVQRGVGTSTYGQAAYGGSVNFETHSLAGTQRSTTSRAAEPGTSCCRNRSRLCGAA